MAKIVPTYFVHSSHKKFMAWNSEVKNVNNKKSN